MGKRKKKPHMFIERKYLKSKAVQDLRSPKALLVFIVFLSKRTAKKNGREYAFNQFDPLKFSFKEAEKDYGIAPTSFSRIVKQLLEVGLIDVWKEGNMLGEKANKSTLYLISDRWIHYGTVAFQKHKPRTIDTRYKKL